VARCHKQLTLKRRHKMLLTNYKPQSLFNDTFFDSFFPSTVNHDKVTISPKVQIKDLGDSLNLRMEMAGIEKKDIGIDVDNGVLTITANRKQEKGDFQYDEMSYGEYKRSFRLSDIIKPETIKAKLKNGILDIVMEKSDKGVARKIEIT